ncbi:UNVERIFIED_CONTAM: hypothetical protein Sangu_1313000 [Sesamum angustifolium]|uniref:Reverse transcriptase domain-containing protein n=1 Tax=Sesamum angustifolium TaxID=2727405 RepID=A0AAW2NP45_9LAMI
MVVKLDMSKTYDRVEWSFLIGVLHRLGFHHQFVNLIMMLVTSVSYSFLLNRKSFGFLCLERGIHQVDPLSPYLFIFCAEALSLLMQEAEQQRILTGVGVADQAPWVSHMLFACDVLVFCYAHESQLEEVRRILGSTKKLRDR